MNFKNRLYQVVENYIAKVGEIDAAEKNLREQEQRETISRVHADERRAEYQKQRSESYRAALTEIEQIRADHAAAVDAWNAMDGAKLHADAEILKLDIPMNQTQCQQIGEKHKDNSLMLSLLCQYADRHRSEALYADRPADANARKRDFDGYAVRAAGVCREPNSIAAAMFLENSGVPASCSYDY